VTEFGRRNFEYWGAALHDNPAKAWALYTRAIDQLLSIAGE
jgi:hypothetical protein